jgi:predicted exporter
VTRVRPALLLGAATTIVGLSGLALTRFPGMRELALFGAAGIAGSLLVTLLVVPAFGGALPPRRPRQRLVERSALLLDRVHARGTWAWVFFFAVVLVGAAGMVPLRWSDGLRELYEVDPALMDEDTRVREMTGATDLSRMVLATGGGLQEALERNQLVHTAMQRAHERGELAGYRSVQPWLPSTAWQRANLERLRDPSLRERFDAAFEAEGFRPGVFAAFFDGVAAPAEQPLTLDDLQDTPIWPIVDPFIMRLADRVVVVTWLRGEVHGTLRDELHAIAGVQLFDQREFLDRAYARYRIEMIQMLAIGMFGMALVIFLRYRRWRPTVAALLPALAGGIGALGVAGWLDGTANLVHVASLLLVCGVGVDYGIFMVESRSDPESRGVALASSLVAALTTMFSFGLLAMSDNPALASVGRSVVVGVICALLTAPVAASLRKDDAR